RPAADGDWKDPALQAARSGTAASSRARPVRVMTSLINRRQMTVEWGHCDPAGIVFNSRFFEFFDVSTWLLFEAALGVPPSKLAATYDIVGIPLVDARARFMVPAKFGDVLDIASNVSEFRRSSFEVEHQVSVAG